MPSTLITVPIADTGLSSPDSMPPRVVKLLCSKSARLEGSVDLHAVDGIVRAVNIDDYAYSRGKKEEAPDLVYIGASQNGGSAA